MAWESGTYACGHDGREQFYGPRKEREWAAKKHFERVCPECWKIECAKKAEEAAAKNKEAALPALAGSEKQVSWAESIRAKLVGKPDFVFALQNTSAKWWIDNRDDLNSVSDYAVFRERASFAEKLVKDNKLPLPDRRLVEDKKSWFEAVNLINKYIDENRTDKVKPETSNPVPF